MDFRELAAQLRKPHGQGGLEIADLMNKGNAILYHWVIDELELKAEDNILEIGMGNGYFVKEILHIHASIHYTGYDYSKLMVAEARKLNEVHIKNNRVEIILGNADDLPFDDEQFSKIFTINTIYFWESPETILDEFKRLLKPGGILLIGIRAKETMDQMPFTQYDFKKYDQEELEDLLINNGFKIHKSIKPKEPVSLFKGQQMHIENIIIKAEPV